MPMVVINVGENESLAYLSSRQVFPTPTSAHERTGKFSDGNQCPTVKPNVPTAIADHQKLNLHIKSVISGRHLLQSATTQKMRRILDAYEGTMGSILIDTTALVFFPPTPLQIHRSMR
jgi:hypothetical protein